MTCHRVGGPKRDDANAAAHGAVRGARLPSWPVTSRRDVDDDEPVLSIPSAMKPPTYSPWFSLEACGWTPRVSWRDDDGTIHMIDGPDAFTTWREAEEASRFLLSGLGWPTTVPAP